MNIYQELFENMNDEEWEFFAVDFLNCLGFFILSYPCEYQPLTFFQYKSMFDNRIQQRMFPSNWGKHTLSLIQW